jgi:hypothetical protein
MVPPAQTVDGIDRAITVNVGAASYGFVLIIWGKLSVAVKWGQTAFSVIDYSVTMIVFLSSFANPTNT